MIEKIIKISEVNLSYKYYFDEDNEYTILIMHGWGGSSNSWANFAELLLLQGFNVIVPDLPGFGKTEIDKNYDLDSYAELVENFVQKLNINKLILWGHSNGGAISIKLENRGKLDIERLILNNSAGIRNDSKRTTKRKILNWVAKIFKKILPKNCKLRTIFYKLIGSSDYIKSEANPYLKQTYLNMIGTDLSQEIEQIQLNTLLIWGEKDTYTPLSDGKKMRKLIKNSKFVMLEDMKHGIHISNPELLLNTFLNNI